MLLNRIADKMRTRRDLVRKLDPRSGLGVRDIPAFLFPLRDVPRISKKHGREFVPVNKITFPTIISNR